MILGIDTLLKRIGILPDVPTAHQRSETRLHEVKQADKEQQQMIENAQKVLHRTGVKDLTEREFMQNVLGVHRKRDGGPH